MLIQLCCALMLIVSLLLLLETSAIRKAFGIVLLGTTINVILMLCGRVIKTAPAFLHSNNTSDLSNPLPQAMILTAIVISFSLLAWLCMLLKLCQQQKKKDVR